MRNNGRLVDDSRVMSVSMVAVVGGNQGLKVAVDTQQMIAHQLRERETRISEIIRGNKWQEYHTVPARPGPGPWLRSVRGHP